MTSKSTVNDRIPQEGEDDELGTLFWSVDVDCSPVPFVMTQIAHCHFTSWDLFEIELFIFIIIILYAAGEGGGGGGDIYSINFFFKAIPFSSFIWN